MQLPTAQEALLKAQVAVQEADKALGLAEEDKFQWGTQNQKIAAVHSTLAAFWLDYARLVTSYPRGVGR